MLAVNGAERVAMEVEMGKSDAVANERRALQAKVDRVLVVATDSDALRVVERDLALVGLLIPGRVWLISADEVTSPK